MVDNKKNFEWCVIGAGPAGIAAVGKLLDHDILAQKILWLIIQGYMGCEEFHLYNFVVCNVFRHFLEYNNPALMGSFQPS